MGVGCGDEKMGKATVVSELLFSHRDCQHPLVQSRVYAGGLLRNFVTHNLPVGHSAITFCFFVAANDFVPPPTD